MPSLTEAEAKGKLEADVLQYLDANGSIPNSIKYLEGNKVAASHDVLVGVLKSLVVTGHVQMESTDHSQWVLTEDGEKYLETGSPEYQVYRLVLTGPQSREQLEAALGKDVANVGWSQCMKKKYASLDKATKTLVNAVAGVSDDACASLKSVLNGKADKKVTTELKKRKMVQLKQFKTWEVKKGAKFSIHRKKSSHRFDSGYVEG